MNKEAASGGTGSNPSSITDKLNDLVTLGTFFELQFLFGKWDNKAPNLQRCNEVEMHNP